MNQMKKIIKSHEMSSFLFLAALIFIVGCVNPDFWQPTSILNCFNDSVVFTLLAVGSAFVILTGEIDVSVGATLGMSAAVGATLLRDGTNWMAAILAALAIGAVIGFVNGLGVSVLQIPSLIFTLGVNGVVRGLIYVYTKGIPLYGLKYPEIQFVGQGYIGVVPFPIILTLIILLVCYYLFYKTKFGRYTVSIGSNEDAAKLVGINVDKIKILVFMLSGVLCAIVGVILASRSEAAVPEAGNAYEMDAIAATVIGGTSMSGGKGNMVGTAFGAILMATIKNGLSLLNVNTFWHQVVIGIFILFAVALDGYASNRAARNG